MTWRTIVLSAVMCTVSVSAVPADISSAVWPKGEYERFLAAQDVDHTEAGVATGMNGAVTVAYNGIAARAGLEALKQGGNAIDAALTAAVTQVAATAGAPTETGILFKDGKPLLGFASMGSGLHARTFQALLNVMRFGMTVDEAINTADFLMFNVRFGGEGLWVAISRDPKTGALRAASHNRNNSAAVAW